MIKTILSILKPNPMLKEINRKIIETNDYKELVQLTNEYNQLKKQIDEDKTNKFTRIRRKD